MNGIAHAAMYGSLSSTAQLTGELAPRSMRLGSLASPMQRMYLYLSITRSSAYTQFYTTSETTPDETRS